MTIWVNGEQRELPAARRVARAVERSGRAAPTAAGSPPRSTARSCRAAQWEATELADGQRVEVVQAVQGG